MGCISSTDVAKPNKNKPNNKDNSKHVETALYKSKQLDKSTISKAHSPKGQQPQYEQKTNSSPTPKILPITSTQFLSQYTITQTLPQSTRLQGPKLLTNRIHGGVSVLRVYQPQRIDQQRLKKYHQIMRFQLYTDEEQNYLLIDQYCSGPSISELLFRKESQQQKAEITHQSEVVLNQQRKQKIHNALLQVHQIIVKFHTNKTYLGNLNVFSFKQVSDFNDKIQLVDINVDNSQEVGSSYEMGHAHHKSFQADWEFFGYLVHFYFYSNKSPVFIPHKMQYVQSFQQKEQYQMIWNLLKGRQVSRKEIESLSVQSLMGRNNEDVLNGYRFCRDILKLVKSRRRRVKHRACYYSSEIREYYMRRNAKQSEGDDRQEGEQLWRVENEYDDVLQLALGEDNLHKLQTERIFSSIQQYIINLNSQCEEHFINYSSAAQNFSRKLKQLFIITDKNKKLSQLKDLIPQIK